ncbi:MNIO family bufferin maturase [Echinimonas agarilytica]|uniref:DUF692 domain-containing protein n=1 Tax=Echinimonas agarilytica TaxID=1215918 RepID=A0AA42B723_9GAMM|nr:DUF692 domain-containing protein [Echinimonas agarilytica]MCM2679151.1 DUF692 domain-containing protein [Echinimonas agarilytica]
MNLHTQRFGPHGVGLGLRTPHLHHVLTQQPDVPWFEAHSCNFMTAGPAQRLLLIIAEQYPLSLHGVSLNLGGLAPLDQGYLCALKRLCQKVKPCLISEHACFTAFSNKQQHDLMPIPFTEEAVIHMAHRIDQAQQALGQQLLIENVSRYYRYTESQLSEGEFLMALVELCGCGILLDLNNAYVNQHNHHESIAELLAAISPDIVGEIHLAGYTSSNGKLIDSHAGPISPHVWRLFEETLIQFPNVPVLIEWDNQLPGFDVLQGERLKAQTFLNTHEAAIWI